MSITLAGPSRVLALVATCSLLLLAAVSRPGRAQKSTDCKNQITAVCQTVERCSGGFEANGSCRWMYSISYYYWRY
jgi:hypothetical protein